MQGIGTNDSAALEEALHLTATHEHLVTPDAYSLGEVQGEVLPASETAQPVIRKILWNVVGGDHAGPDWLDGRYAT